MIKLYLKIVVLVVITLMTFGLVLPFLFSARDYILVIAGFVVLATYPVFVWYYGLNIVKQFKKWMNN